MAMAPLPNEPRAAFLLYPGFAANVFWNYQSPGMINGGFHGIEIPFF